MMKPWIISVEMLAISFPTIIFSDTEASLVSLLDELTGNEFDMQGINELRKLLGGAR